MGKIAAAPVLCVMLVGGIVSADTTRPAVKGKKATLTVNKSVTLGGVSISLGAANHKHAVGGETLGMWTFVARKGGSKKTFELRSEDAQFEAEVALHGVAFVFKHVSYDKFDLTLVAQKAPKALDEDACAERILAASAKLGLTEGNHRSWREAEGIVVLNDERWRGYCGTLTKRVWIEKLVTP